MVKNENNQLRNKDMLRKIFWNSDFTWKLYIFGSLGFFTNWLSLISDKVIVEVGDSIFSLTAFGIILCIGGISYFIKFLADKFFPEKGSEILFRKFLDLFHNLLDTFYNRAHQEFVSFWGVMFSFILGACFFIFLYSIYKNTFYWREILPGGWCYSYYLVFDGA